MTPAVGAWSRLAAHLPPAGRQSDRAASPPAAPSEATAAIGGALVCPANDAGQPACTSRCKGVPRVSARLHHGPERDASRTLPNIHQILLPPAPPGGTHGGGSVPPCARARPRPRPAQPAGQFECSAILMLFSFKRRSARINSS